MHDAFNYKFSNIFSSLYKLYSLTFSVTASRCDGSLTFSVSLSPLPFFSFIFFFFSFISGFSIWFWGLTDCYVFFFFFYTHTYIYIYIYFFFKVFMGSWKLLGWLAGIGMGEVRGAQAKNQGAQALFMKILYTKKKNFWTQGGPGPLCPLPGSVPACTMM